MLHAFLSANRAELIERCKFKVAQRSAQRPTGAELEYGIPLFLDQLVRTLAMEEEARPRDSLALSGAAGGGPSEIGDSAAHHGRELLQHGFTFDQVVHGYGDLCQAVTDLAHETRAVISTDEFRTLNRCLDNAIAGAVGEFARQRDFVIADRDAQALHERLGFLAHELRNLIHTATLALSAIKAGNVGLAGSTGAALDRSLIGLRNLVDRSLADVRVSVGMPPRKERIALRGFLGDIKISAGLEAEARAAGLRVTDAAGDAAVLADRELLSSAVHNLLQNAFKFSEPHSEVMLRARAENDRVLIEVEDQCGGLHPGGAERMLLPHVQMGRDRSGLGLGLSICRRSVEANDGRLSVRNVPGSGCVFTIDLPRAA